jgi:cytochrome c-type biogenesis protein CcsB
MAALSDHLLVYAILGYTLAMLAYAVEYAFGSRSLVARVAQRDLVGAGGPPAVGLPAVEPAPSVVGSGLPAVGPPPSVVEPGSAPESRAVRLAGRVGYGLTALGWLLHLGALVTRGLAAHRVPWGNMYEFVLAVCLVGATAWLVLLARRPQLRPLGLFVTLVLVLLLGIDGMLLYTKVAPLQPALNSYWLKIHVTAAITASGTFLVGFVAAAMTLIRSGYDAGKRSFPYSLGDRLPGADGLERTTFRVHAFAFPIWTFAVICGAIWAEAAWGRYWGWDPKETWSFIAWVSYAGYLHARATPSVQRTTATWLAVLGWAAMMVNLFGVNLVISGLHSYAGVK